MAEPRYTILPPAEPATQERYTILPEAPASDPERTLDLKGLPDRGDTLIGDTGIGFVDAITGAIGRTGYALADNIIGFDDGVDTFGERLGSGLREAGEGVGSGVIGAVEGAGTSIALAPDYFLGTEYGDAITEGAEALRDTLGLDPEGIVGKGAEIVTQFVVPGGLAAKGVSMWAKADRAKKGLANVPFSTKERFGLAAKELLAAGAVDGFVSTDNMTTLGDWAEMGYTQTDDLIGLRGQERALARFNNKFKLGLESTLLGGVAQAALMGAGKTVGQAVKSPAGQATAAALKSRIDRAASDIDNLLYQRMMNPDDLTALQRFKADAIAMATPKGFLPESASEARFAIDSKVNAATKAEDFIRKEYDTELNKLFKEVPPSELEGNLERLEIINRGHAYLTEADDAIAGGILKQMPGTLRPSLRKYREKLSGLSKQTTDTNFLKNNNITTHRNKHTIKTEQTHY